MLVNEAGIAGRADLTAQWSAHRGVRAAIVSALARVASGAVAAAALDAVRCDLSTVHVNDAPITVLPQPAGLAWSTDGPGRTTVEARAAGIAKAAILTLFLKADRGARRAVVDGLTIVALGAVVARLVRSTQQRNQAVLNGGAGIAAQTDLAQPIGSAYRCHYRTGLTRRAVSASSWCGAHAIEADRDVADAITRDHTGISCAPVLTVVLRATDWRYSAAVFHRVRAGVTLFAPLALARGTAHEALTTTDTGKAR